MTENKTDKYPTNTAQHTAHGHKHVHLTYCDILISHRSSLESGASTAVGTEKVTKEYATKQPEKRWRTWTREVKREFEKIKNEFVDSNLKSVQK